MILAQFVQNVVSKATQTLGVLFFFPGAFLFWGARLWALDNKVNLTTILEPFDKGLFSHGMIQLLAR